MAEIVKNNESGLDKKTLFVRSIPFEAKEDELADFFSQFAPLRHAIIVKNKVNKVKGEENENENDKVKEEPTSKGFGFVSFAMEEDATTALSQARKTKFKDRLMKVDFAKRREREKKLKRGKKTFEGFEEGDEPLVEEEEEEELKEEDKDDYIHKTAQEKHRSRLIIRNLPWSVRDPAQLKKHFQRYGTVNESIIPRKKDGKMSGFAFIHMKNFANAKVAVEKSKKLKIDGREVKVEFALEKSKYEEIQNKFKKEVPQEEKIEEEEVDESESESENIKDGEESKEKEKLVEEDISSRPKPNKQEPYTIFIRNLPYNADKEGLKTHFEQFGPVKYALPVIDKESGLAKGTGFVAFSEKEAFDTCLDNAPDMSSSSASLLISDDVGRGYVYEGRILSIKSAVDREKANVLQTKNSEKRAEILGKEVGNQDKRNLFLLNEGRILPNSKLASLIGKAELEIREKSYKLRIDQLNKNPSLHLSLTRLAIRNLPRVLTEKSLKALGRKAVVGFATQARAEERQPLSQEEIIRSTKHKHTNSLSDPDSKKSKKKGLVRQAKILVEVSKSGEAGRSKGYGFLEYKDHKSALMALRFLNTYEVSKEDILAGLSEEEANFVKIDGTKRRLIVEFAIEHADVVNRRKEKVNNARQLAEIKKSQKGEERKEEIKEEENKNKRNRNDKDENEKIQEIISNKRRKKNNQKRKGRA